MKEDEKTAEEVMQERTRKPATRALLKEYSMEMVQRICELFLNKPCMSKPVTVYLPEVEEPICMVLSSEKTHYYRTTPTSCTCKGWHYSQQKYGVGMCRHLKTAFKAQAETNQKLIDQIEAQPETEKINARRA